MPRPSHPLVLLAAALIIVAGLKYTQPFVVPVLCGVLLAAVSSPISTWVTRRGLPAVVGALAALLVDVAVLAFAGVMLILAGGELHEKLPVYLERASAAPAALAAELSRRGIPLKAEDLPHLHTGGLASLVGDAAVTLVDLTSSFMMVILVVFFTLCDFTGLGDKLSAVLHDRKGGLLRVDRIVREIQTYLLAKTLCSFLAAILAFVLLKLLHVDLALLLALLLFFLHFIPNVGSLAATAAAVLVALASCGPGTAAVVAAGYGLINALVGNVLEPKVLGQTLGLSPLVVLLGMLFWGWLWGALGALLSVPLMMVAKIILENSTDLIWVARIVEPAPDSVPPVPRRARSHTNPLMNRPSVPIGLGAAAPGSAKVVYPQTKS